MTNEEAVSVFQQLADGPDLRLQHGLRLRSQLGESLRAGEKPEGYRYEFITQASAAVLDTLIKVSEKFNTDHPDDLVSTNDLADILATTMGRLKKG